MGSRRQDAAVDHPRVLPRCGGPDLDLITVSFRGAPECSSHAESQTKMKASNWARGKVLVTNAPLFLLIVSLSSTSRCFALAGTVVAWGGGQIGPPGTGNNIAALSAAIDHSLALDTNGSVLAWGYDFDGQCDVPAGLDHAAGVAAGGFFSVALKSDHTVLAWGDNQFNQTLIPSDATNVIAISAARPRSGAQVQRFGGGVGLGHLRSVRCSRRINQRGWRFGGMELQPGQARGRHCPGLALTMPARPMCRRA